MTLNRRARFFLRSFVLAACAASSWTAHARDLVVAQVAPFSGSQAVTGRAISAGAKLYFDYINAQGGVNGSPIRFVTRDDAQKPDETIRLVNESLRADDPVAFIGTVGTDNVEALIKDGVLARANVPLVGAVSGASSVVGAPAVFVVKATYHDEVDRLFQQLSQLSINRIGLVYQDDALGKDVITGAEAAASRRQVTLIARAGYPRNTIKVEDTVEAMLRADPQAIFLGATTAAAIEFVRQYRARGGHATIYGMSIIDTKQVLGKLGPQIARGFAFSLVFPLETQTLLPVAREYAKLKAASKDPDLSGRSIEGFIAAKTLVAALRTGAANGPAVVRAMQGLRRVDLGGFVIDYGTRGKPGSSYVDFGMFGEGGKIYQ